MPPDPVYNNAARERMLGIGQPICQLDASAVFRDRRLVIAGKHRRESPRNEIAQSQITAPNVNLDVMNACVTAFGNPAILGAIGVLDGQRGGLSMFLQLSSC